MGEAHLLVDKSTACLTGIDMLATESELAAAIKRQTGLTVPVESVRLWRRYDGLQKGHIKLPRGHCEMLEGKQLATGSTR